MNMIKYERDVAMQNDEIIPSFCKLRRFKGAVGYPPALGYYERRFTFRPLDGESLCVQPHEIEECADID